MRSRNSPRTRGTEAKLASRASGPEAKLASRASGPEAKLASRASDSAAPTVERGRFAVPPDQAAVARAWSARGFSCQPWVDPPGQAWNDFVHGTRELVTVLEGRLEFSVGGKTLVLEPGDELLIPRDALHSVKNIHPRTSRWLFGYDG